MAMAKKVTKGGRRGDSIILNPGSPIPNSRNGKLFTEAFFEGYNHARLNKSEQRLSRKELSLAAAKKYKSAQITSAKNREAMDVSYGSQTRKQSSRTDSAGAIKSGTTAGKKVGQAVQLYAASNRRSSKRKRGE